MLDMFIQEGWDGCDKRNHGWTTKCLWYNSWKI